MADFQLETHYGDHCAGFDEVGRGPLAGPVVAACVYIPPSLYNHDFIRHIADSKTIPKSKHSTLSQAIQQYCIWGIAECSVQEIDQMNILQASLLAMERAAHDCHMRFNFIAKSALIDGKFTPANMPCPSVSVIKGDQKSVSIGAASIIAKFYRDSIMKDLSKNHPHYGWEKNAGYGTKQHLEGLMHYGPCEHHRQSFAPVRQYGKRDSA